MAPRRRLIATALVLATSACSSASSSTSSGGAEPIPLPNDERPPLGAPSTGTSDPMPPSSPGFGQIPSGCPAVRSGTQGPTAELESIADFRELVVGIYRACDGSRDGLELRIDPQSNRLSFWYLDERFVRRTGTSLSGWVDIEQCATSTCTGSWHAGASAASYSEAYITVWTDPIALQIEPYSSAQPSENWVRVAE